MTNDLPPAEKSESHGSPSDVSAAGEFASRGCRQRLTQAMADAPPRRHELEVLRLYLDKQRSEF